MRNRAAQNPLSDKLNEKVSLYALAAAAAGVSALALPTPAEAEVVYTPAHQVVGRGQNYAIDFNHDGITDFTLENYFFRDRGGTGWYFQAALELMSPSSGATVCSHEGYAAAALSKGAKIGSEAPFAKGCNVLASAFVEGSFGSYSFGDWFDNKNQYLGLRFEIDGETHYGWARLTVGWENKYHVTAEVSGYAYETEANTTITAGDTGKTQEIGEQQPSTSRMGIQPNRLTLGALAGGTAGGPVFKLP
jgi:hypothetical protein